MSFSFINDVNKPNICYEVSNLVINKRYGTRTYKCNPPAGTGYSGEALQMRRKAETLKYKQNSFNNIKKRQYAYIARGNYSTGNSYSTQSDTHTNPNTLNLPIINGSLVKTSCPSLAYPTTYSDVPGPTMDLCYNEAVPLVNYYKRYMYVEGGDRLHDISDN